MQNKINSKKHSAVKIDVQKKTRFTKYHSFLFTLHWHQNQATDGDKNAQQ